MLDNLKQYNIILASNSPRRKELLAGLDIQFEVKVIPGIDENCPAYLKGSEIPRYLSRKKAEAYIGQMSDHDLIITADTVVWVDDTTVLGKPADEIEAGRMLRLLSGKTHDVITGVTIMTTGKTVTFAVESKVTFDELDEEDIDYYISHYHPMDKAGAYGIQEWIGFVGVTALSGSYFNVMGLPVQRLYKELKCF